MILIRYIYFLLDYNIILYSYKQTINELEATIARIDDPETNKRENDKVEDLIKKRWIGLLHGELHDDWLRNYSADQEFYDDVSSHAIRDEDNAFYSVNIESFEKDGDNVYIKFELNIDHKDWVYESNDNIAWIVDGECGVLFDHILPRKNTADKYKGWAELTNEEKFDRLSGRQPLRDCCVLRQSRFAMVALA